MAVFKATSYTKERGGAKASVRYIQGRPGRGGERLNRQLFGTDGAMSREQATSLIDKAKKGALFYRLVISPDPRREDSRRDLSLWEMTQKTMRTLEERLKQEIAWVGAEHSDHTEVRHVHVIAVLRKRLRVNDLTFLRQSATQAALLQRQRLDLVQTQDRRRSLGTRLHASKRSANRLGSGTRVTGTPAKHHGFTRSHNPFNRHLCTCPYCLTEHDKRQETKTHHCSTCRRKLHEELKPTLFREKSRKEAEWSH